MLGRIRGIVGEAMEDLSARGGPAFGWEVLPADPPAGGEDRGHFSTNAAFQFAALRQAQGAALTPVNAAEELKKYLLAEKAPRLR